MTLCNTSSRGVDTHFWTHQALKAHGAQTCTGKTTTNPDLKHQGHCSSVFAAPFLRSGALPIGITPLSQRCPSLTVQRIFLPFLFLIVVFEVGETDGRGSAMLCDGRSDESRAEVSRRLVWWLKCRTGLCHSLAGPFQCFPG